jgi:hypothetical protein
MNGILKLTAIAVALCGTPAIAEDEEEVGILSALGLTAASGKTTLAEGAGEMEGVILSAAMFPKAVQELKTKIMATPGIEKRNLAILDHDDPFDLSLAGAVTNTLRKAIPNISKCPAGIKKDDGWKGFMEIDNKDVDTSGAGLMATAIGALKVDSTVSSYSVTIPEHHLLSSFAAEYGKDAFLPNEIAVIPTTENSDVLNSYAQLIEAKKALEPCKESEAVKPLFAKIVATEAAIAGPGKDDGPSLLERAARQGIIANKDPLLLRLNMEKAGGTVINRANIFLQLGFPGAVVVHNGMKLNYRLVNPKDGSVLGAGSILCRHPGSKKFERVYRESIEDLSDPGVDRNGVSRVLCTSV